MGIGRRDEGVLNVFKGNVPSSQTALVYGLISLWLQLKPVEGISLSFSDNGIHMDFFFN